MSHNPYSPPASEVADVAIERSMQRPRQVVWAVWLLWGSVILSFVLDAFQIANALSTTGEVPAPVLVGGLIGVVIGFLIAKWFIGKISLGRNWARILMLVLTVLGFAAMPLLWPYLLVIPPIQLIVYVIQEIFTITVLFLVFTGPGKFWFRPHE